MLSVVPVVEQGPVKSGQRGDVFADLSAIPNPPLQQFHHAAPLDRPFIVLGRVVVDEDREVDAVDSASPEAVELHEPLSPRLRARRNVSEMLYLLDMSRLNQCQSFTDLKHENWPQTTRARDFCFISHRWVEPTVPLARAQIDQLRRMDVDCFWLDYYSVPQDNFVQKGLPIIQALNRIIEAADSFVVLTVNEKRVLSTVKQAIFILSAAVFYIVIGGGFTAVVACLIFKVTDASFFQHLFLWASVVPFFGAVMACWAIHNLKNLLGTIHQLYGARSWCLFEFVMNQRCGNVMLGVYDFDTETGEVCESSHQTEVEHWRSILRLKGVMRWFYDEEVFRRCLIVEHGMIPVMSNEAIDLPTILNLTFCEKDDDRKYIRELISSKFSSPEEAPKVEATGIDPIVRMFKWLKAIGIPPFIFACTTSFFGVVVSVARALHPTKGTMIAYYANAIFFALMGHMTTVVVFETSLTKRYVGIFLIDTMLVWCLIMLFTHIIS